jgi:hypothetical protein
MIVPGKIFRQLADKLTASATGMSLNGSKQDRETRMSFPVAPQKRQPDFQ